MCSEADIRRLLLVLVGLATVLSSAAIALGTAVAVGSLGDTDTSMTAKARSASPPLPRVTMITDSVGGVLYWLTNAREELAEGLDFHLETGACRKLVSLGCYAYGGIAPSALETIQELGPEIGSLVIVDVGYNDFADGYADELDTIMAALVASGVQHVVWVTLEETQGVWAQINVQIRAAPARWPQLVVADWAPVAAGRSEWFVDAAHMNDLGGTAFAHFLRPIVLEACGAACVPPPAVATLLRPIAGVRTALLRWTGADGAVTYDLAVKRDGGAWRTVVLRLAATSYRLRGVPGLRLQARVRARAANDTPGPWSPPRSIRM